MDKLWIYVDIRHSYEQTYVLRATLLRNEDNADPPRLRNILWEGYFDDASVRQYADLQLRLQTSPSEYSNPPGAMGFYAYSVGIEDTARPLDLNRMETQIKVLRKFARASDYGVSKAPVDSLRGWVSAVMALARFVKADGFVVSRGGHSYSGSWDGLDESLLIENDSDASLEIYHRLEHRFRAAGHILQGDSL